MCWDVNIAHHHPHDLTRFAFSLHSQVLAAARGSVKERVIGAWSEIVICVIVESAKRSKLLWLTSIK